MSTLNVGNLNVSNNLKIPSYTSTQRDNLSDVLTGDMIYNITEEEVQIFDGTAWTSAAGQVLLPFTRVLDYTGAAVEITFPAETESFTAYIFGPGGGAEGNSDTRGGAGGFTVGTITQTAGDTFKFIVGGAGRAGTQSNGCGGGYSGVFTEDWAGVSVDTDHNSAILMAGGGGGSANSSSGSSHGGGAGGGLSGQQGNPSASGGGGGSQTSGGSYGGNGGGSCTAGDSCVGDKLRGGTGCGGAQVSSTDTGWPQQIYGGTWGSAAGGNGCNAGGAGAGYYGGGGGGGTPNGGNGGGGSGYIGGHPSYPVTLAATYAGNGETPPTEATGSPFYGDNISRGGRYNTDYGYGNHSGGPGRIVIEYQAYEEIV